MKLLPTRSISSLLGLVFAAAALACLLPFRAHAEPATSAATPSPTARDERDTRMAWWREARFGMFIHWGLYAVPAGTWQGHPSHGGNGEWIMNNEKIPIAEYAALAPGFNPEKFDADAWVKLTQDAGMKYIILTAKHHEGFAMFHTKSDEYNIWDATPFKRDPVAELANACHRRGMRFGLYYSQNLDWHHPGGGGGSWDPAHAGDPDQYVNNIVIPQVREILTSYGDISVLWWDIPGGVINKERADRIYHTAIECNPHLIMNNRLGGGYSGDTETPEQHIPAQGFGDRDWETCMTINGTWGFRKNDTNWKSTATLLRNLIDIASKGGNYLLNVGPDAEGVIPAPESQRLKEIGAWLKVNGEAIYGTQATPFDDRFTWGRATRKGNRLYLHVFSWPKDGKLQLPVHNPVQKAYLLADPELPLITGVPGETGVELALPAAAPDPIASVIVVEPEGAIDPIPLKSVAQDNDGSVQLKTGLAHLRTSGRDAVRARVEGPDETPNIGFWTQSGDYIEWTARISRPARFDVVVNFATDPSAAGSKLTLTAGNVSVSGVLPSTGGWKQYNDLRLGTLQITQPGMLKFTLNANDMKSAVCNLRAVTLTPVP